MVGFIDRLYFSVMCLFFVPVTFSVFGFPIKQCWQRKPAVSLLLYK